MREKRKTYIKFAVSNSEKEGYDKAAEMKGWATSLWMRETLNDALDRMGYKWPASKQTGSSVVSFDGGHKR